MLFVAKVESELKRSRLKNRSFVVTQTAPAQQRVAAKGERDHTTRNVSCLLMSLNNPQSLTSTNVIQTFFFYQQKLTIGSHTELCMLLLLPNNCYGHNFKVKALCKN